MGESGSGLGEDVTEPALDDGGECTAGGGSRLLGSDSAESEMNVNASGAGGALAAPEEAGLRAYTRLMGPSEVADDGGWE